MLQLLPHLRRRRSWNLCSLCLFICLAPNFDLKLSLLAFLLSTVLDLCALFLSSPPCLRFCSFPAFPFLGSPLGLGLQSLRLVRSLTCLGFCSFPVFLFLDSPPGPGLQPLRLFHLLTLFRRRPWLIQRFDDFLTEALNLLSDLTRMNIEMTPRTPIDILPSS